MRSRGGRGLQIWERWRPNSLSIMFAISRLERIQDNRLLVFVRVTATSTSARKGTFLGSESPDSSGASEAENPDRKPFSLASATMTDDQTQQRYPVLPPVAPPGKAYFPGELVSGLHPGQGETLTIRCAAPPWLPLSPGGKPARADGFLSASGCQRANYEGSCSGSARRSIRI